MTVRLSRFSQSRACRLRTGPLHDGTGRLGRKTISIDDADEVATNIRRDFGMIVV
jgi:hypothetical protein